MYWTVAGRATQIGRNRERERLLPNEVIRPNEGAIRRKYVHFKRCVGMCVSVCVEM